jgi:hypothetical protein
MRIAGYLIVGCTVAAVAAAAQTLTFQLNPVSDTAQRVEFMTVITVTGDPAASEATYREERHQALRLMVEPADGGFLLTTAWEALKTTVNGTPRPGTLESAFGQHPVGYRFNAQGELTGLQGVGALTAALASGGLTAEAAEAFLRRGWTTGIGGRVWTRLAGQEGTLGKTWTRRDTLEVAGVEWAVLPTRGVWTHLGTDMLGAGDRAKLQYDYTSDTVTLSGAGAEAARGWLAARVPALAGVRWQSVQLDNQGEVVVSPTTLACYRWDDQTQMTIAADDAGRPPARVDVRMTMRLLE